MGGKAERVARATPGKATAGARPETTKRVRLEYFAQFREERGVSSESIETSSQTAAELYDELNARHSFRPPRATTRVAVNDAFVTWSTVLHDGDTVVFLTPFGGG